MKNTPSLLRKPRKRSARKHPAPRKMLLSGSIGALVVAALSLATPSTSRAATFYWDSDANAAGNNVDGTNLGGTGTWDNLSTVNWWDPVGPTEVQWNNANFDTAVFTGTVGTVTLSGGITAGGLTFNTSGYLLTGGTLTLAPAPSVLSPVVSVAGIGLRATVGSVLAGTSGFTKVGSGTLVLTNSSNTFSGDIAIKEGQIVVTDAGQLGTGTTAISVTGFANTGNPGYSGGALMLQGATASASAAGITLNRELSVSGRGPNAVNNTGGLVSIGYNTIAGGFTFGAAGVAESRAWATHGATTISGSLDIGVSGVSNLFQGNGNWIVSGVVTGSENAGDRFVKTGQLVSTTLWLQNSANNFTDSIRVDSGTLRVNTNGALGQNVGTGSVDLNNGTLEVRTDAASGFAGRSVRLRNNVTGTVFVDHDTTGALGIGSSMQNQTVTFGTLTRDTGANNTNFTYNGRNGYSVSFSSILGAAGDRRGWTLTNNSSGTVTYFGDVWNMNNATAATFTVQGNGDTAITGSILATGGAHVLAKGGTGTFYYGGTAGTYTGATNISAGTLSFSDVGGFANTSVINIGNATTTSGALTYTGGAATLSRPINLNTTTANVYINASGTGALTIDGTITAVAGTAKTLVLGGTNTGDNEIQSVLPLGGTTLNVQKIGVGTWQLSGANLFTGSTTVSGGTLKIKDSGASVNVLPDAGAVIFNTDVFTQAAGGTFNYVGGAGASTELVGALTETAGHGIITVTPGGGATTLTFGSLAARTAGATVNVSNTGVVNVTGTAGFLNAGTYFASGDFAYSGAGTTLRAPVYGTDAGFVSAAAGVATLTAGSHNSVDGAITAQTSLAVNSLKINGANDLTLAAAQTLTVGTGTLGAGILQTGGSSTISGGAALAASAAGNDFAIRVDGGANSLTINTPMTVSTAGLTKSGAGTLILGGANTYSGTVNVNEGTLQMATGGLLGATNVNLNVRQGATFDLAGVNVGTVASGTNSVNSLNGAGTITNSGSVATLRVGNNNGAGYFTGEITGTNMALVKNGSGALSLTNTNSSFSSLTISAGTVAFALPEGTTTMNAASNSPIGYGATAADLVFNGGTLQYAGANTTIYSATQTPSISTDRQFTLAANGTIDSSGSFGNAVLARNRNDASIVFTSTADVSFSGAGVRTLTLTGDSIGDNEMRLRLTNNPNAGEALSLTKTSGSLWILNPATSNDYTGTTTISGGALRALISGPVLGISAGSLLTINGGVLESSGTFTRTLGAAAGNVQLTGGASGFASASTDRFVVSINNGGSPLTWGSATFAPTSLVLGSSTALGETEITNDINLGTAARTVTVNNNGNTGAMVTAGILSGVISGGAGGNLTKNGGGVLILGDANTYVGNTVITGGNVVVTSIGNSSGTVSSSLGASGGTLIYSQGDADLNGIFYVGQGETATRPWTLTTTAQLTANRSDRIDASGSGSLVLAGTFANTVTANAAGRIMTLELRGASTDANMITSVLTNSTGTNTPLLAVTKNDGGVWILNPATPNTFTSTITLGGGLLGLTSNGIGSASQINFSNGGIFAHGGALTTSTLVQLNNNTTAVFAGPNAITLNGNVQKQAGVNDQTFSNNLEGGALLTVNGDFVNLETAAATRNINIRGIGSTVWNGLIQNNSATSLTRFDIRIADSASFTLGGDNKGAPLGLTGGILLGQGTLIVAHTGGLGPLGNSIVLDGGVFTSTVNLSGVNAVGNRVQLAGDQVTINGSNDIEFNGTGPTAVALENNGGNRFLRNELDSGKTLTISGQVNLSNDNTGRTLTVRGSGDTTISGVVANGGTGAGGLAYSGLSTLKLTGANTATGALTVNRNAVELSGSGAWSGTVTLNPIGTLTLDNSGGNANRLADAGAFTGQGGVLNIIGNGGGTTEVTGALTLNSVQTYITMSGGNVDLTFASVNFANSGSSLNLGGIANLGTNNFVRFTTAPSGAAIVIGGIIPRIFLGGTDFAKYDVTNGVVALAPGDYNTGNNLNTAAATDTMDLTASSSITANRTVNAIKINGTGLSVGGSAGNRLTLTSGGILNTGGNNSLDASSISFTNTPVIQVASGTTLTVNSGFIGSTNLIKVLPGTLEMNVRSFVTGTHNLLNGTTKLISGGVDTFFPGQLTNINNGATLDLNGGALLIGQLSDPGVLPEAGGIITSGVGTGTLVANSGTSATVATNLNGSLNFAKASTNTITLESVNTYSGSTHVFGGTLQLQDDSSILNTSAIHLNGGALVLNNNSSLQRAIYDRVNDTTAITLRDGTISFTGKVSDPSYEVFGALTAAQGANTVTVNTGGTGTAGAVTSADVTFASLTRSAATTVNFTGTSLGQQGNNARIVFTTPLTTVLNGALGAWAIANTTDYAAYNTGLGIGVVGQGGFIGYDGTFGSGNITDLPATAALTTTLSGATSTGLLRISGAFTNDLAFTAGTDSLNLEQGGILRSNNNNATTIGTTAIRGHITSGTNELIVFNNQGTTTIHSFIDGATTKLIKSGGGTLTLSANNTYGGGTAVIQGTLRLEGGVGDVVIPAGGLVLGGATVTMIVNSGQIDPSNVVTIRRSSTLSLVGNNTLDSLVFENNGGTGNPTVTVGGTLTLSNASAPVTVTDHSAPTVATISGGILALGSGAKTFSVEGPNIGGTVYTNLTPSLNITSAIIGSGSITKSNTGILQLSGQSIFNGLNVTGGGILISGNSTPTQGGGGLTSGPLGVGAVAMSSGTTILVDGSRTVGNDISFAGTPIFDSTANTVWTLTLNGSLTGAGLASPTPTIQIANPFLTVALLGNIPNIGTITSFNKTGLGTLIFNATGYTGDFNATALGNPSAVTLINDGDGTGSIQTLAMGNVIFDAGVVPNITVNRSGASLPFPLAANKILAPASISNTGLGLTVTNNNGYGLKVSDATAFSGTPTIFVNTATASNVTQGLYLVGDLTGTGFNKTGGGTVVIENPTPANNTFTGNININQGGVSVNADAQLGNPANVVRLNPTTGTSTFRATGTIATSRTIELATASNTRAIEVTSGNTLTLNSGFLLTAPTAALLKGDLGTLELAASNAGWSGNLTINAGVVSTSLPASLGSGTVIVNETSAALQLNGGIVITNPITIDVLANGRTLTGLNTGGAVESVTGSNTIGTVTVNTNLATDNQSRNYGFGADNGATLNIGTVNLNHPTGGTNRNVIGYFNTLGTGAINVTGAIDNTNGSPGTNTFLFKIGDGTMTLTGANAIPDTEVRVYRGGLTLDGAATFGTGATQVQVWQSGTMTLDNSTTNTANRFSNRVVQMGGGTLNFIPNAGGTSHVSTGALQISQGANTINLAAGGNQTVTFASLTQNAGSTLDLTGTFGSTTNKLTFTTAPTLSPAGTGLLARVTTNGNEFATYNATNGIVPFTAYSGATNILGASATQTFKATTSTLNSLTGNQTLNALTINNTAAVGGLGGNPPAALTLTSGGILANGSGGAFLNVPIVSFGGAEGIIHVESGQSLTVNSGMNGTGGLNKDLGGTLNLNAQQFISNNTYVNGGTLNLAPGATNTLLFNNGLGINGGAVVDLKNGVQFIGSLFSANAGGNTDLGGGTVTNSGAEATLVTNSNSNFNGQITGTIFLNKTGTNSLNLQQAATYTGATLITGGTLTLQDDGTLLSTPSIAINFGTLSASNTALRDNSNRISDTASITLNGGIVNFQGRGQANSSETVGAITLGQGHNGIFSNDADIGIGSGVLTVASVARSGGSVATLRFNNAGDFGLIGTRGRVMITSAPTLTNNIIGPWAVVDREFASYDATFGVGTLLQTGFPGYAGSGLNSGPLATDNVRFTTTGTTTLAANTTVGTLTFGQQGAATTLDLNGNTLTIQGGGLIFGQGTDNVNFAITNGNLTGPAGGGDLYIHHLNYTGTNRTASIDAAITDNGGAVRVIKSSGDTGASVMTWNGTNTFTGGLVIDQGTLVLGATGTLTGSGSAGITVMQSTLTQTAGGVIPSQPLTLGGGSTVTLAGNNTLTTLTINNLGGGAPTLNPTGTLTLTGGITATTMNAGNVATIGAGTLDLNGGAGTYSIDVGATVVNGVDVAPWQAGLIINSVIQNDPAGGIVKSGAGLLQLSGQSTFSGGLSVTGGGLIVGASSTPSGLGNPVVTGPLGTGTVTMAANTSLVSTAANTVSNNFVFLGDTVFNGIQNLTLNGDTTLPSTWNVTVTAPQMTVTIGNVIGSLATDVTNKSGLGTLILGNYNGTINIAGGLIFLADGNELGTVENVSLGGNLALTADTAVTVNRSGGAPNARNKQVQKVNLTNNGSILAVNNVSGYGLEFTGTTTLTGASHFSVSNATASNLVQGLTLSGVVSDTGGFDLVKSGLGTLALTNGGNTFGGVGKTIDVLNGILSANSDGALGNINNSVTLEVDGTTGVGFRGTGPSWGTSRTFNLNAANNAFEVVAGTTLTLNTPFALSSATNTLTKNDSGILAINADNVTGPAWTGAITINGGAIQVQDSNALGSGAIAINNAVGSALQLSGGVAISNAITLTTNSQSSGINSGGSIQSVSGVNTYAGLITQASGNAATYGADAGATLNINGNIATANTASFYTGAGGVVNLNSILGNGGAGGALTKWGPGDLNVTVNHTAFAGAITVNAGLLNIAGAGVKFGITGTVTINGTGTVSVDDTAAATSNRLGGRALSLAGGTFSYLGNAGVSTETLGTLTVARPGSTIIADSNGGTSTITFGSIANNVLNGDASLNFVSGTAALGSANNKILFTTAPTLTNSIIQRATVDGTEFATYAGGTGIAAFTAYSGGVNVNTAAATATMLLNAAPNALTANRTVNAIKFSGGTPLNLAATGAAFVAGGATPAQLTLSAGAIIADGGVTHTLSVPVLNNVAVQNFYNVTSGTTLEITSAIVGTAGWVKTGAGTVTFSPPSSPIAGRGASTISGNATINEGTVILNGGNNTLAATNFIILGPNGTLNLNGNSQLGRLMTDAAVENGGGIVTGNASSVLVTVQDNTGRNWAGSMQGAMSFLRTGDNTLTMYSDNTYTGKTLLAGATTALRDSARLSGTSDIEIVYATLNIDNTNGVRDLTDRVNDAAPITLRGGTINFLGRAQTASTETLGDVTLVKGNSFISSALGGTGVNSADLTLTSLTRAVGGGTINFTAATGGQAGSAARILIPTINGASTATVGGGLVNGIIGGWAIIGTSDFATYIPGLGVAAMGANGALQYSNLTSSPGTLNAASPTDNISINTAVTGNVLPVSDDLTINSLRMGNVAAQTVNIAAGKTLTLTSGGLLFFSTASQVIGSAVNQGAITSGGPELFIYTQGTGPQIINSAITGSGVTLVKSGANALTLNGTNTYDGGTTVNQGTLTVAATSNIPLAATPANGLVISGNGSVVTLAAAGLIASGNIVTINGNASLNLVGNNTLAGLVYRDDGGGTGASVVNSLTGVLTLNGNIVSTTANPASTSTVAGRLDLGGTVRSVDISATRFNGQELAALLSDFNLQGVVGSSGGFTKDGDGVLQFNGQAIYTGPTTVTDGRIQIGATNAGSRFSALTLQSGTGLNINGVSTTLGSLAGSGYIMNSSASTTAQTLTVGFDGTDTTFSGTFLRFNDATANTLNLTKIGVGTMKLTAPASSSTSRGQLTVNRGVVAYTDLGSSNFLSAAHTVNEGGTLRLDNSDLGSSANVNNRLSGGALTLNGGALEYLGRDATASTETAGVLTLGPSASTITLTAGGSGGTAFVTFASLTQNAGSTATVSGTNLGTDTRLLFTTAPTEVPATTGILARIAVGTDFATYDPIQGVIAFTGYTTRTDINAGATTETVKVDATTTVRDITLARTVNALKILDDNVTLGSSGLLLPTQGLTVTSGGIIVTGNDATISTPVLALGAEGILRVFGDSLNITSSITGTAGMTKTRDGDLTLSTRQSYTGQTALSSGNMILAGGANTILVAPTLTTTVGNIQVNGGVLDLNGNNQAFGALLNSNTLAFAGGVITNSSATTAILTSATTTSSTFGANLTGNLAFTKAGSGNLTLPDAQSYTGATIIRGGTLTVQDKGALYSSGSLVNASVTLNFGGLTLANNNLTTLADLNPTRLPASVPVTLRGGTLSQLAGGSVDTTGMIDTVTVLGGASTITVNVLGNAGATNLLSIGSLVRAANNGSTIHFASDPGITTQNGAQIFIGQINGAAPVNNAFLGAGVIINSGEYGVYNTTLGVGRYGQTGFPAYSAALASGNNLPANVSSTGADVAISANTTIGALRLTGAATRAITFTAGTETLNLALGGLLRDNNNNAVNIGTTALRGKLTSGGTATSGTTELVEWHNQNTVTIHSVIADNGLGNLTKLVKAGPAATTLTAANTYTGGTVVNAGTLTINATAGAGTVVIPAGGVTLNNANLTMSTNAGQIDASNDVAINGGGVLTLVGSNTLNSLTFANMGGTATPTVAVATSLTLSAATAIDATNDNFSTTPTISGTALVLSDAAPVINVNAGLSPSGLIITAPLTTTGGGTITKTGGGSLILNGGTAHPLAGGLNVNAGTLVFDDTAGTNPYGTGTISLASGVAIRGGTAARTVPAANAIAVAGDFTFGTLASENATANATNNLTLAGTVTLAAGPHTITVNGLLMTGAITGKLTGGTDLTKDGPGTLVLQNATNDYGGSTTVNAGILQLGAAGSIPDLSAVVVALGGFFNLNGLSETIGSLAGGGVVTNTGAAQTLTLGADGTDTTFTGSITNQANALTLAKVGGGTQTLSGVNSYTGNTTITAGTLRLAGAGSLGAGSYAGAISNSGTFQYSSSAAQTLTGVISGTGAVVKDTANGVLTLAGAAANTYSGLTTVSFGRVDLNKPAGVNAIIGDGVSSKGSPDVLINGGELRLLANNQIDDSVFIELTSGTFNRNGKSETIFQFTNSGGTYLSGRGGVFTVTDPTWSGGANHVLGTDIYGSFANFYPSAALTISGGTNIIHGDEGSGFGSGSVEVQMAPGNVGLEFAGTGSPTLTLSSDDVAAGILFLNADLSFTGSSGTASILNGNKLQDNGDGTWTDLGSAGTNAGTLELSATTRTFDIGDGSAAVDMLIGARINGTGGGMIKQGAGTLALTGANTYTGATTISAGTLQLGTGGATGSLSPNSAITNNGTLTFNRSNALSQGTDFSNTIGGSGSIIQAGAGTTTLSSTNNSYSGGTTVNAGTLAVTGSLSGTNAVTVNSGGTLLLNSSTAADNIINTGADFTGAGGTLKVDDSQTGRTNTFASMTLSANTVLDFGTGNTNTLLFGSLNAATMSALSAGTLTLTISGWTGSMFNPGETTDTHGDLTQDRLLFSADPGFTLGAPISGISFTGFGTGMAVQFGGQYEIVPVPEPATTALIGAVALCALIGYRERRRIGWRKRGAGK